MGASGNCEHSPLLTVNQRSIVAGKKYRAVVHYKSTTAGGLNQIKVHFSYP